MYAIENNDYEELYYYEEKLGTYETLLALDSSDEAGEEWLNA